MSSHSPAEISFNGADFEQTNRFPSQYHSSCQRAFVYRFVYRAFARVHPHVCRCRCLFRSRIVDSADSATAPSASSVLSLSLHPLDCIDHRWEGVRRKRLVYSSISYRYVNGESRSRWDHTCICGPRVHFPHAVTNVRCLKLSLPFGIHETVCGHWELKRFALFQRRREH